MKRILAVVFCVSGLFLFSVCEPDKHSPPNSPPYWTVEPTDVSVNVGAGFDAINGEAKDDDYPDFRPKFPGHLTCVGAQNTCSFPIEVSGAGDGRVSCRTFFTSEHAEKCAVTITVADGRGARIRKNVNVTVKPMNVILFIGDGWQLEYSVAESRYLHGSDFGMTWDEFDYQSYATTWDVSTYNAYASLWGIPAYNETTFDPNIGYDPSLGGKAPYPIVKTGSQSYLLHAATDSASAATALATGVKTDGGNISWLRNDPPDGEIETIAQKARDQRGAAIGVVSTVPFNHATPAAFVSHNANRSNYGQIADEIINVTKPDVVIGGGHPNWSSYINSTQLDNLRSSTDYVLVERIAGQNGGTNLLNAANSLPTDKKLFGLFGGGDGSFSAPVPADNPGSPGFTVNEENPSLAEATQAALTVLSRDPDGFFVMIEQGSIDWTNHANNYSGMIGNVWDLDEAVKSAVAFVDQPGDDIDWTNTLLILTADHGNGFMRLTDSPVLGAGDLPTQSGASYPDGELTYSTGGHTNELVMVYAMGDCSALFQQYEGVRYPATKIIDNTTIYQVMKEALGLY